MAGYYRRESLENKKRLDLNDLIKRAKDEEKQNVKNNIYLAGGILSIAAVATVFFNL